MSSSVKINPFQKYLQKAHKKGFSLRYAKEFSNHVNKIPTMKMLENSLKSNFARNFKNHFGPPKISNAQNEIVENLLNKLQLKGKNRVIMKKQLLASVGCS